MTDLHTHILPRMDDGSGSVAESLALLEREAAQGVDTVVLTPHFYREREPAPRFLARRQAALEALEEARPPGGPALVLGAEVAWFPSLHHEERLEELCLGGTRQLLLELPFQPWTPLVLNQVYGFYGATGVTPVFAHVERYLSIQDRARIDDLISMGFPMQMNADSLLSLRSRGKCLGLLRRGRWYVASDCHNLTARPPRLGQAAALLRRKLGRETADRLLSWRAHTEKEAMAP